MLVLKENVLKENVVKENTLRRTAFISLLMLLALASAGTLLAQQTTPVVQAQSNTVFVGADGRFESAPDTAMINFNISAQEDSARAASDRASNAAEQIRQILRTNGIDPKDAQIGFFSIQPVYDYRKPARKLVGYRVNSNVNLKVKDFTKVAPITQQLSDMDVTENTNVTYTLENMESAKVRAVQDAFQHAKAEAAAVAQAGSRTLGDLSYASVDVQEQIRPVPLIMKMQRGALAADANAAATPVPADFTPQQVTVTAHVNAMFALK
jgi:uncharacterized protein YggE